MVDRCLPGIGWSADGGSVGEQRIAAAVKAIQFHDIGGQWLLSIASQIRTTHELVMALRVPFDAMKSAATGDWQGFERGAESRARISNSLAELKKSGAAHPVGHTLESFGDVDLF